MTTMEHFEEASNPTVFDRTMLGEWRANGSKDTVTRAHEIVEDVFANYQVLPIPEDRLAAMKAVVEKADADFLKSQKE
jgi:trimethylamine--corrinoid protein Co-methyltransferase